MANPTIAISIGGTPIDYVAAGLHLESIAFQLSEGGGATEAEFTEFRCDRGRTPTWLGGQSVEIDFDFGAGAVRVFTGRISSVAPMFTSSGWVISYQCAGIAEWVNRIPVRNPDGMEAGSYDFNLRRNDRYFVPTLAGKTVGEAVAIVLNDHAAALAAAGVTTTFPLAGGDLTQFTSNLTLVPPDPFSISGDHLWNSLEDLIEQWHSTWKIGITPTGEIKLYNPFDSPTATLTWTEGDDPIEWSQPPGRDISRCFTRVVITGQDDISPRYLKLSEGDLEVDWTTGVGSEQASWSYEDFSTPDGGARFEGSCTCTANQVTFDPADNTLAFAAEIYGPDDRQGVLFLRDPALGGLITQTNTVWITSHGALTAGGTVVFDIEPDMATTSYTEAVLSATAAGRAHVWRRYAVASQYQGLIRQFFPRPVPFVYQQGDGSQMTESPMITVQYPGGESSLEAIVDPVASTITAPVPVTIYTNGRDATGGAVDAPDDVIACLPIKVGALQAIYPPDVGGLPQYSGTANTVEGLEETLHIYLPSWNNATAKARIDELAQKFQESMCNTVLRGSITYHGIVEAALSVGWALNVDGVGHTTGYETAAIPARSVMLRCAHSGGPEPWSMEVQLSNERRPFSGDRLYTRGVERPRFDGMFGAGTALQVSGEVFSPGISGAMLGVGAELSNPQQMALGGIGAAQGLALGGIGAQQGMALGGIADSQGLAMGIGEEMSGMALDQMGLPRDYFERGMAEAGRIGQGLMQGAMNAKPLPKRDVISGSDFKRQLGSLPSFDPAEGMAGAAGGALAAASGTMGAFGGIGGAIAGRQGAEGLFSEFVDGPGTPAQKARQIAAAGSRNARAAADKKRIEGGKKLAANRKAAGDRARSNTRKSWDRELVKSRNAFNNAFMPNVSTGGAVDGDVFTYWREDGQDADELLTAWSPQRSGEITASGFSNGFEERTASEPQRFDPRVVEIGRQYDKSRDLSVPKRIKQMNALTGRLKKIDEERKLQNILSSPAILAGLGL